jgi:nucleotide-binding universal stress UspA family protein
MAGTPTFGRILVGTDGSKRAEVAVRQGARLAKLTGAQLEVVYVIDSGHAHAEDLELAAAGALEEAGRIASVDHVEADVRVLAGDPAEGLARESAEHGVGLVCVGPDAGLLERPLSMGRVAEHVLRQAPCSVLIAREAPEGFPSRIICGVDGSESSAETARLAARLALSAGVELRLLHVIPVFRGHNEEWDVKPGEEIPVEIAPAIVAARSEGIEPKAEMAMGRPEDALVEIAKRDGADLVVVGHRGISGMARRLLGSVSDHVATHADRSVLVVRPGAR